MYGSRSRGSLRVIDFVKGEDRRLLSVAPDRAPGNLLVWRVLDGRIYFHMETWSRRGKGGPTALWRIGLDGANLEQMEFTGPGPEDHEYLDDVWAADVSPDGRYLLLAGIGLGMRPSAVFRVDLSSTQGSATRISPEDEELVADGSFTADGRGVMMRYSPVPRMASAWRWPSSPAGSGAAPSVPSQSPTPAGRTARVS